MKNKFYVTYRWLEIGSHLGPRKAIECPNEKSMLDCGHDIYSLHGIRYVRFNTSGRLRKGTKVIPYEDYQSGKYIDE